MRSIVSFVLLVVVVYACIVLFIGLFQRHLIYFPPDDDFWSCPMQGERIVHEGTRMVHGGSGDVLVVVYHGNAESVCGMHWWRYQSSVVGFQYLFVEYEGYGSSGRPHQQALMRNVEHAVAVVSSMDVERVVVAGQSLGTTLAVYHGSLSEPDHLLLISPFVSLVEVARVHYPWLPVGVLLRDRFDTGDWIDGYQGPISIISGEYDGIITPSLVSSFIRSIGRPVRHYTVPEDHNTLLGNDQLDQIIKQIIVQP